MQFHTEPRKSLILGRLKADANCFLALSMPGMTIAPPALDFLYKVRDSFRVLCRDGLHVTLSFKTLFIFQRLKRAYAYLTLVLTNVFVTNDFYITIGTIVTAQNKKTFAKLEILTRLCIVNSDKLAFY